MRKLVRALIYKKWFYAFLAAVLWFDCYTDVADVIEAYSPREVISLIMSTTGATAGDFDFCGLTPPLASTEPLNRLWLRCW